MDTKDSRIHAIEEVADILIYTIAFCNRNNIDISEAILNKLKKNKKNIPKINLRVNISCLDVILFSNSI